MKRSRMREVTVEVTVGVVMFMIMLALGVFTIILSRENIFAKYYPIRVKFDTVEGLTDGDNVLYHGVKIGVVKSLKITDGGILVDANLDYPVKFHEDYEVKITASSVLGGHNLCLEEGSKSKPLVANSMTLKGAPPISLIDDASDTFAMIKSALGEGGIITNLEQAMANINEVSAELKIVTKTLATGQGTLGKLLMNDDIYDKFDVVAGNLASISDNLVSGKGTIGKLLTNDDLYNNIEAISVDIKALVDNLTAGKGTLGRLMVDDSMYVEISAVSSNLAIVTDRLVAGEGTLGKLSKDSALYDEFKVLIQEAIATLDDLRETTPITSFSTIFFGAF